MCRSVYAVSVFFAAVALSGCNSNSFKGDNQSAVSNDGIAAGEGVSLPGTQNISLAPLPIGGGKDLSLLIDVGRRIQQNGQVEPAPVALYFVLDVTASMEVNIEGVKQNVVALVNTLIAANYNPRVGLIAFRDSVVDKQALTSEPSVFLGALSRLVADGGDDSNEAALLATQVAIQSLLQEETRPGALKVVIPVTDNPAHYGIRERCQIESVVQSFNAIPAIEKGNVKFFYSANSGPQYPITLDAYTGQRLPSLPKPQYACGGFATARQQFDTILQRILPEIANPAERGGSIEYPISQTSIVSELIPKIKLTSGIVDRACLTRRATVVVDGREIFKWQADNLPTMVNLAKSGQQLPLRSVIKANEAALYNGKQASVNVNRCCLEAAQLGAQQFPAQCVAEQNQTVTFTLSSQGL